MRNCLRSLSWFVSRRKSGARGAAAVEFAALAPVLGLTMIAIVDIGRGIHRKMQVQSAAQAGLEHAIFHGFDVSSISSAVVNASPLSSVSALPAPIQFCGCASNSGVTAASCGSTCSGGSTPGTYARVTAQATYQTLLSYPGLPKSFDFRAQAVARLQ